MVVDLKMADRVKARCDRMLKRAESDFGNLEKQGDWEVVSSVVKGACRNALQAGMIEIRCNNDIKLAKDYFLRARDLSGIFVNIPAGVVTASSLDIPIYCCLLSGDLARAKSLATVVLSEKIKVVPGSHFDVHAQMLSSFVLNDVYTFERTLLDFNNLEANYWWEKQRVYFSLYRAVLDGDQASFDELLLEATGLFRGRGYDKDFGNQLGEYGGLEYNGFAIDFMSIGIAAIARSKGLSTQLDNEYFPNDLLEKPK